MSFDFKQASYTDLRSIFAERSDTIVAWVGAGLSVPAGLPGWLKLRASLASELETKVDNAADAETKHEMELMLERSRKAANLWQSFTFLKKGLGGPDYNAHIKRELQPGDTRPVPPLYKAIWELRVQGIVNLNLDRLAQRAFSEVFHGAACSDFVGREVGNYTHVLRGRNRWLAHLHGQVDNTASWIFNEAELRALMETQPYKVFVQSLFTSRCVVFVGISADDEAVGGHLAYLTQIGVDCGSHFWITDRQDATTVRWARDAGIRVLRQTKCAA